MEVCVIIPSPLRSITNGDRKVILSFSYEETSVESLVTSLSEKYSGIREKILDENAKLHPYINIFLNGEDIRYLDGLNTVAKDGDEVSIVPAVAGGY
ncbi:MAG: molybdopterin synthase sulfur carrier subunit [Dehalococcoidia bacterium]|nr:molybdopterin synthase sulfur carrier subunit [Dehalococcoidia bacterium]|tara:strand:+ start:371 stop:661 length:291 start_codon:yes stop_codon:yes gene_type:complete